MIVCVCSAALHEGAGFSYSFVDGPFLLGEVLRFCVGHLLLLIKTQQF
jgi:hypothetical protein